MKISNIFLTLLAGGALVAASSCVEHCEYTPAEAVALSPYYFSTGNSPYEELEEDQTSFAVTLGRIDTNGELTLDIQSTVDQVFSVPSKVTFADGEGVTTFDVTFDVTTLEKDKEYLLKFALPGIEDTPYSLGNFEVTVHYLPWRTFDVPGIYAEVAVPSIFGDQYYVEYEVEIQEDPHTDGIYRIVNPYSPDYYPFKVGSFDGKKHYLVFDTTDPENVVVPEFDSGLAANSQYGTILLQSQSNADKATGATTEEEKRAYLEDGNVFFPEGSLLIGMSLYNGGKYVFDNVMPGFIVLPGYKIAGEYKDLGWCDFTDGFYGPYIGILDNTYKVLVQKHKKKKNIYRIVSPFGPESGYVTEAPAEPYYMEIDARDADCVLFGATKTPQTNTLKGDLMVTTIADSESGELSKDELKDAGFGGKMKDGVITLEGDQVFLYNLKRPTVTFEAPVPCNVRIDLSPYLND